MNDRHYTQNPSTSPCRSHRIKPTLLSGFWPPVEAFPSSPFPPLAASSSLWFSTCGHVLKWVPQLDTPHLKRGLQAAGNCRHRRAVGDRGVPPTVTTLNQGSPPAPCAVCAPPFPRAVPPAPLLSADPSMAFELWPPLFRGPFLNPGGARGLRPHCRRHRASLGLSRFVRFGQPPGSVPLRAGAVSHLCLGGAGATSSSACLGTAGLAHFLCLL